MTQTAAPMTVDERLQLALSALIRIRQAAEDAANCQFWERGRVLDQITATARETIQSIEETQHEPHSGYS